MKREEAAAFVRELGAVNTHDSARLLGLYADDAVLVSPVWGELTGHAAIAQTWEETFARFPDWTVNIDDTLVDGDRVVLLGRAGATDRNGWFGLPPTGERFEYRAVISLTIKDGKIVRDERIYDLSALLQRLEKARLDQELRMAADVQRALLSRSTHATPYCEAVGDSIPCRAIGGDFFELAPLPSGNFGIALGDVAGKGPASALLASLVQGMLAIEVNGESGPAAILTALNGLLARRGLEPRFVTLVYGVLSPDGKFVYANAGHNPPMLLSGSRIERLTSGGLVLGAFVESGYEEQMVHLRTGDSLILFSDGVTEARDAHDEEFGEERLIASATAHRTSQATQILKEILSGVQEFCEGAAQTDDITVTVVKYRTA